MKTLLIGNQKIIHYALKEFEEVCSPEILSGISDAVSNGFGKQGDPEDVKNHVFASDHIGLIYEDEQLLGFATTRSLASIDLCYLHGVAVATTAKGIGTLLVKCVFAESGMSQFGFTTQNPGMYSSAKKSSSQIYPHPEWKPTEEILEIGRGLVKHRQGNLLENMAVRDLYPDCLYPKIPVPKDESLWRWWQEMLRIDDCGKSNDGIVFVGKI